MVHMKMKIPTQLTKTITNKFRKQIQQIVI
jgi:hypothetical protein